MFNKINITASQIGRFLTCSASSVLPSVKSNESNEAAFRGNVIHKFLEDYIHIGREKALETILDPEYKLTCESINMDSILQGNRIIQTEIGFKYNIENKTAVRIQNYRDIENKHTVELVYNELGISKEITGIADLIIISDDGEYTILDYKTGFERVSAINNPQLSFFAMCIHLINKPVKITVGIVTISEDGNFKIETQELNEDYINKFQKKIENSFYNLAETKKIVDAGKNPDVITSDYCKYCPAINSCPAYNNLALSMSTTDNLENLFNINSLSNEQIGIVWEKIKQAQKIIEIVEKNIKDLVKKQPIVLPNGKLLAQFEQTKEYIDAEKAEKILIEELGEEITNQILEKKITKTKLRTLVDDKKRFDEIIKELSKKGAIRESTYVITKEGNIKK